MIMRGSIPLPPLDAIKDQARRLRSSLASTGSDINHSKALELVASQYGFRDWNTLMAAIGNRPRKLSTGDRVSGHYLGQRFSAEIIAINPMTSAPGRMRITVHFDEPVDVVTFDSFSAFRRRVSVFIDETGKTVEKTSNGRPHMELDI